jgi:hypothetical protein
LKGTMSIRSSPAHTERGGGSVAPMVLQDSLREEIFSSREIARFEGCVAFRLE